MPVTYPPAAPSISGDTVSISRFLNNPALVARRLRTLLEQRYISDRLLSARIDATGSGAVQYETSGESIFTTDNPEGVPPGAEYPLTQVGTGPASIAKTVNWGEDAEVTDVAIARLKFDPVNKAFTKLVNQNVKYVDSVALGAISSAVTNSAAAAASWSSATAAQLLRDVALAKANIIALNQGYDPDTVVIDDINYAYAFSTLFAAGYMPREAQNPLSSGVFPQILGMTWMPTPNLPTAGQVLVADSMQLGGMADEKLGGPGYTGAGQTGVEIKTIRDDPRDRWLLRCRRVTVPIVNEPAAARKITGV